MRSTKEQVKTAFAALRESSGYTSVMATPRVEKVVVSSGTGRIADKRKLEVIIDRLARITGQRPSPRPAKQAIAGFKTRKGQIVGYQVTLRGSRMYDFLDKFLNIALPRTRDFRGVSTGAVDAVGNLTIGVPEHTIFPETADEEQRDIFGLSVTIVSSARTRDEALPFFGHVGVPFKRGERT